MKYDPRERRYHVDARLPLPRRCGAAWCGDSRTLVRALGYDMNSIEWAIRGRRALRHRLHEPGAGHGHQLAHAALLRVGGASTWPTGDPAGDSPGRPPGARDWQALLRSRRPGPPGGWGMSAMVAREIVDDYHDVLTEAMARESAGRLEEQLGTRRLFFGDRPLCTVLRPRFLTPAAYQGLRRAVAALLRAFESAQHAALAAATGPGPVRARGVGGTARTGGYRPRCRVPPERLDTFLCGSDGTPRCTEYNAETPAGAGYGDVLSELFLALPGMQQLPPPLRGTDAPGTARRTARAARDLGPHRVRAATHDRHSRLGRRADPERVPDLPRLCAIDGLRLPHRGPAGPGVSRGSSRCRRPGDRPGVQAGAHLGADAARWDGAAAGPRGARGRCVSWPTRGAASCFTRRPAWRC